MYIIVRRGALYFIIIPYSIPYVIRDDNTYSLALESEDMEQKRWTEA